MVLCRKLGASADAVYGLIAGLGLTFITNFFIGHQFWVHLAGGAFLCYLGIKIAISKASENPARVRRSAFIWGLYLSFSPYSDKPNDDNIFCWHFFRIGTHSS